MTRKQRFISGLAAAFLLLAFCGGAFYLGRTTRPEDPVAAQAKQYPLLSRRIFSDNAHDSLVNFSGLRQSLRDYFDLNKLDGSLYFEYLPTGTSIRVAGDEQEVAASLMKVPVAMELYRAAELGRVDLDRVVALTEEMLDEGFGNLYKQGVGYRLTLRQAAKIMLSDSDNTALRAIGITMGDVLNPGEYAVNALDVDFDQNADLTISLGARSYSSFLKCLYYSCYNSNDHSNEILSYLTHSPFNFRLEAGIPSSVKVAHKIGVHGSVTQSDCGIIYLSNRHYLLCIMLRGSEDSDTDRHFAELSKRTYDFMAAISSDRPDDQE